MSRSACAPKPVMCNAAAIASAQVSLYAVRQSCGSIDALEGPEFRVRLTLSVVDRVRRNEIWHYETHGARQLPPHR